ncbi:hypothetical protein [Christensenella hongkongensis]|uniref:hypothetical protein n=1 Tax=Christensenella hongkongensis TaxID=270498 RepID=UPI002671D701|nr:hypothetical protein [Christensenella hongkongensis]
MAEQRASRMRQKQKKSKKWIAPVILLILAVLAALLMLKYCAPDTRTKSDRDMDAMLGQMPGKTQQDYADVLNRVVEEGMFNISIDSNVIVTRGTADVGIENIAQNHFLMKVEIYLQGQNGDRKIYESGLIAPGYYIEQTTVDTGMLRPGSYAALAVFHAINPEDETTEAGSSRMEITLTVKE